MGPGRGLGADCPVASNLAIEVLLPEGSPTVPALRRSHRAILGVFAVEFLVRIATFRLQAPEENGLPSS
jgi:hypothetical protein